MNPDRFAHVVAGNAGSGVWVDGQLLRPGPAGFPAWLDLDGSRLIYQSADGTLRSCDRYGSGDVQVDARGGAPIFAAAGEWAAFLEGQGTRTSWGLTLPEAVPLGMAPDGTLFVTTYQNPREIRAYRAGSLTPLYTITDANPFVDVGETRGHCSALDSGRIVWVDQGLRLRASGFDGRQPAHVDEPAYHVTVLGPTPGALLLSYSTQTGRLIVHAFDSAATGYVLDAVGYGFTGVVIAPNVVDFFWARNQGEAGTLSMRRLDLSAEPGTPIPPVDDPIPSIGRRLWFGGFSFDSTTTFPGNCDFQVHGDGYVRALDGRTIAQYVSASPDGDVDALEAAIAARKAVDPVVPVLAYCTAAVQAIRLPKGAQILGVEAYQHVGESSAAFEARIAASAAKGRAWLIPQAYTSNTANVAALRPVVVSCARVTRAVQTIEGWLAFSGSGRATGYQDHPEVHDAYTQAYASVTGEPSIDAVPPILHPTDPLSPTPSPAPTPTPSPDPEGAVMGAVLVDVRESSIVKHFLDAYTQLDEAPHPDGHDLVSLKGPNGYLSLDPNGNLNASVSPAGWASSAGAYERFNVRGGAYVHDLSGAAIPRYAGTLAKLP